MATSALPSASVMKAWNDGEGATLQTVLTWARVAGPLATPFLTALDTSADKPYKSLMLISEAEAAEITYKVVIGEAKPGPLQLAKIRLVFAAIWHASQGGQPAPGQGGAAGPALPDPPPPTGLTASCIDAVAMDGCVTQSGSTFVRLIPKAEHEALLNKYKQHCGAGMSNEATPTKGPAQLLQRS